ncbi:preprotein translocase subunit SecE [Parvularcula sp. ZS-1/3]|uniref:Protein translocase subunit SecE n=1 Tax=Parvularcula mediterranea TaxID=2732508 RepID=A0A7Y3W4D6_9PROT|nr:preprotein translocase subunit SecE [Parvularcula mediterranea]NNU15414.1 preprotein translocase subunit SecE [Parvularcula mediterranea]
MPKSKNRRKVKNNRVAGTGAQASLTTEPVEGAESTRDAKPEAAAVKKKGVGPVEFFQQVRSEAMKITWTSRGETMVSTIMVLIMVAIMSLFFFAVDQLLRFVVPQILALSLV